MPSGPSRSPDDSRHLHGRQRAEEALAWSSRGFVGTELSALGPINGEEIGTLQIHCCPDVERVLLGDIAGLERIVCSSSWSVKEIVVAALHTVRHASFEGVLQDIVCLRDAPLEVLSLTLGHGGPRDAAYVDWKAVLAPHARRLVRLVRLHLGRHNFESILDLPDLPNVETLDLSDSDGFLELGGFETKLPKLRRLVLARTALTKRDTARFVDRGFEIVV